MNTYEKICEIDSEIQDVVEENSFIIFDLLKKINFPKTGNTMWLFITKTSFIKNGIFDLYESQNLYSIYILFRSLIEHYLRFEYIFFRFIMDKNDTIGDDYMKFCSLSENIDTGRAWKDVAKIIGKNPKLDPYDALKKIDKNLNIYSKQEIIDKSNQFKYKNIIKFINDKINKEESYEKNSFLLNIIPEYSDLSSFVHGGPNADKTLMENVSEEKREIEMMRIVELTFSITASVKLFSFLIFCKNDNRLSKACLEIKRIMKKISNNDSFPRYEAPAS